MKGVEMGFYNRRVILIILAFFLSFLIFYSLFLFPQQRTKESRRKARVAKLNSEIESAQKALDKEKARVHELMKGIDFNFTIAGERPFKVMIPSLLEEIQHLSSSCGIVINRIEPMKEEDFETYRKYPFTVEFISDYRGLVKFVRHIENDLKLNLGEFSVESQKGSEGQIFARFIINAYEMKDGGAMELQKFQKAEVRKRRNLISPVEIKRDPFQHPGGEKKTPPLHEAHHLQGIIKWGKSYQAIIDNKEYKVGDILGERTIVDIQEDRVILDGKTPPLVLKRKIENKDSH